MPATKPEIVLIGPLKPVVVKGLDAACTVYKAAEAKDRDAFIAEHAHVRAIACSDTAYKIPGDLMARFPKLQIVSSFGVGYDHMDAKWAAAHNVILTNTARRIDRGSRRHCARSAAVHGARISPGRAPSARRQMDRTRLSAEQSLAAQPHRRLGRHGRHRSGRRAAARRLGVPVVYHTRQQRGELPYRYYPNLHRHGARRRYPPGDRARWRGDGEYDRCRQCWTRLVRTAS